MRSLNMVVCVKAVPDPKRKWDTLVDPKTHTLVRKVTDQIINPLDRSALFAAVDIKRQYGGRITVLSMGPATVTANLKEALASGADRAFLLCDQHLAGSDTLATSYALGLAVKKTSPDFGLILCGASSLDGGTAQVGPQLAVQLGLTCISNVLSVEIEESLIVARTAMEHSYLKVEALMPLLLTVTSNISRPRPPTLPDIVNARGKNVQLLSAEDIGAQVEKTGVSGSPTRTVNLFIPDTRRKAVLINESPSQAVEILMENLAKSGKQLT